MIAPDRGREPRNGEGAARISLLAVSLTIAGTAIALSCLVALHVLSPEFQPSWRMVSEYALGSHEGVLSFMFWSWGMGTWCLASVIWHQVPTIAGRIGRWALIVAGLGEAMASVFDVRNVVGHGVAGALGVLGLPIAAVLISRSLDRNPAWAGTNDRLRRWAAHVTWISVVLLAVTLALMTAQVARANGGKLPQHAPKALPPGVIGLDGWADRLIILSSFLWVVVVAVQASRVRGRHVRPRN